MIEKIIFVSLGGVFGALLRYGLGAYAHKILQSDFPYGTLIVNLAGCFAIGLLWGLFERFVVSSNIRVFAFIGVLGSFTTFSSYGLETFNLLRDGELKLGLYNVLLNNAFGIMLVFAGYFASKYMIDYIK